MKFKKKDFESLGRIAGAGVVLGALFWVGSMGYCYVAAKYAVTRAETLISGGYSAVAADVLDEHRKAVIRQEHGCSVILTAYFNTRRVDRLEWAGEACIEAGNKIPDAYLGLAAVREIANKDQEALQLLASVAPKFDKIPDIYYRIGVILRRNKNLPGAEAAYLQAVERAGSNNQVVVDVMEFLAEVQHWDKAKDLALKLKDVSTENIDIKLLMARIFKKSGDQTNYAAVLGQAKDLLDKRPPAEKTRYQETNSDLFAADGSTSHRPASIKK